MPKLVDVIIVNRVRLPETFSFYMFLEAPSRLDLLTAWDSRASGRGRGGVLYVYGGGPFVLEFIEFPQWTRNFRPPRAR